MIDIQNCDDYRGVFLHNVGIKDLLIQATINDQHTLASVQFGVSLDSGKRGIHMSRLCQLLDSFDIINNERVSGVLTSSLKLLNADSAAIAFDTTYFRRKKAPMSDISGTMSYIVHICANKSKDGSIVIKHRISIPITAVCPCSKAISNYGAHNQRGMVSVTLLDIDVIDYDNVIDIIEKQAASYELYSILKREDEKKVTESAYENAKFVEDIVRDALIGLRADYPHQISSIESVNYESIHNHNAFAFYNAESASNCI